MAKSEGGQTEANPTPIGLIGSASWTSAFFTTYALSLTFFESVVLRELRRIGCEEVWIFVDADGYRASLGERRAFRIGQEYRVVPISMPKGVFHAKCTFLSSPTRQLLLLGSGNLTFGGFGRNLEVLETIDPRLSPRLGAQFSEFIRSVTSRPDLKIPDRGGLNRMVQLLSPGETSPPEEIDNVRILSSAVEPVLDGVRAAVAGLGKCSRLTVLSPYFDSEGAAVKALAEACGADEVAIGLPPNQSSTSSFPFSDAKKWKCKVSAVIPKLADERRPLHAKWMEAEFARGVVTLTGSINATWPALCTTNNVEIGVLRISQRSGGWICWESASIPTAPPVEIEKEPDQERGVLHAKLEAGGKILGSVLTRTSAEGSWAAVLSDTNEHIESFHVSIDEAGDFVAHAPEPDKFAFSSGLQLSLERDGKTIRGWVHQEEILHMPKLRRLGITSLLRLINRQETQDDDVALLDYLSMSANRHLRTFGRRIPAGQKVVPGAAKSEEDSLRRLSDITPESSFLPNASGRSGLSSSAEAILERVFGRLRHRLVLPGLGDSDVAPPEGAETEDEDGRKNRAKTRKRGPTVAQVLEPALKRFEEGINREIERAEEEGRTGDARTLRVIWFEVKAHMLLTRLNRPDQCFEFTRQWLATVTSEERARSEIGPLEQYVVTCTVLCCLLEPPEGQAMLRSRLHEDLERFFGGAVNADIAVGALLSGTNVNLVALLSRVGDKDIEVALESILSARTVRKQLEEAFAVYSAGGIVAREAPVFQGGLGAQLYSAFTAKQSRPLVRAVIDGRSMCAHCYIGLEGVEEAQLQRHRIIKCFNIRCHKFTIRLSA